LNCQELIDKVLEVEEYLIAAYRINRVFYPYIIVLNFKFKEKTPIQVNDSTVQDVCHNTKVKEWIRLLNLSLTRSRVMVSSLFNLDDVRQKYLDIQAYEPILEMILSTLYKNRIVTLPTIPIEVEDDIVPIVCDLDDTSERQTVESNDKHPVNNQHLGELTSTLKSKNNDSTQVKDLILHGTESRKQMASDTTQAIPKKIKTEESVTERTSSSSKPLQKQSSKQANIPNDFDEQCQKSIQAEFDALTLIQDKHVLYATTSPSVLSITPSSTDSVTPSFNMDLDVLPMQNPKLSSPLPPSRFSPLRIELETPTVRTNQIPLQPARLAKSLKMPSKCLTARQRRLAFEKIRRESLLEFLRF
jgi:hypothetical protein